MDVKGGPMIQFDMVAQPIVDITNRRIVMQEWLCKPVDGSAETFFQTKSREELWYRESLCIRKALEKQSPYRKSLNLTMSSLPYFLETEWTWDGVIEIVEWPTRSLEECPGLIDELHNRGLEVWLDDLTSEEWPRWKQAGVDGFKIAFEEISAHPSLLQELLQTEKPIVVERIESLEMEKAVHRLGILYGQGFYYLDPKVK